MIGNGQGPVPQQEQEQRPVTAEDIQRQQRAYLSLRALDLEAENILLQQEIQKLKAEIEELKVAPLGKNRQSHPVPSISDA
jgi:hypothetical protein